jgi:hypothetical protein
MLEVTVSEREAELMLYSELQSVIKPYLQLGPKTGCIHRDRPQNAINAVSKEDQALLLVP